MRVMRSRTCVGVLFVGLSVIACDDDGEGSAPSAMADSARGARAGTTAEDASSPGTGGPVVRVDDAGAHTSADAAALEGGVDASALDGGVDASALDGGVDASVDGSPGDAMPSPMPIEDAALDAHAGAGGFGGFGGRGGAGGVAAFAGF